MSFGLLWLSSVILSNFMFIVSILRAIKDVVDEGYRISVHNKINNEEENLLSYLILLVPILNVFAMLSFSALIINDKGILLDTFKSKNMLEKMTEEEYQQYSKNPTLLNAFKMCINNNKEYNNENLTFKLSFENIDGIIEYTLENDDVKIVNSTMNSKYDYKTQINLVKATLELFYQREITKFKNEEELVNYYLLNSDKLLNRLNDFKIMTEDQEKIKIYFLEFEFMDKYKEILLNKEKIDNLEKEVNTLEKDKENIREKLELINKLKSEYKRLLSDAIIINNNLSNYEDFDKIENIKDEEVKQYVKEHSNVMK